jgi:uncharacterized membrane protein YvlD (DUF360 family)
VASFAGVARLAQWRHAPSWSAQILHAGRVVVSLLRPIRTTSATSAGLARERVAALGFRRLLVTWVVQALILLLVGRLVPGIEVQDVFAALIAAVVLGLLNALVRPVLVLLTLPLTVMTMGLLSLVINAIMLVLAAPLVPGLNVSSLASAMAAAILITILTTIVSLVLSSDQDDSFYAELSRRLSSLDRRPIPGGRGLVMIQIDGLAASILRNAIRVGLTPQMARWVRSGEYRLIEWDCTPPSQTSASQAGILFGSNDDIPAFRWYEKERGKLMVSNHPADAAEIERRLSNGKGLLAAGGMSANNLFSGDAKRTLFTMSRLQQAATTTDIDAFSLYFVDPAAFIRTIVLTISEMFKEWSEARRQRALDVQPRVHRGAAFAGMRAVSNVLLRDLNVTFLVNAMGRGVPIMYVDFVDYDELAHHAGPERLESLRSLTGVDRVLSTIARAAKTAPRDYEIVILSDHGQTQGATFLQRYGRTLEALIRDLMGGGSALKVGGQGEGWGPANALLSEITNRPGVAGRAATAALGRRVEDGAVEIGSRQARALEPEPDAAPQVVVGASGNLANVYFLAESRRLSLEEVEARYPGLVSGLIAHPGIGFVLVRSDEHGPLVIGRDGVHHLVDGRIDGRDPLAPFGPRAADALRRLDGFAHVGDLLVNSVYDQELEEVAAFEELVGSHGGFGGPQVRPFILAPVDLPYGDEPVVGAPAVHRLLASWADHLGVGAESGATEAPLADTGPRAEPRAIGLIALLTGLTSLLWLLGGLLFLLGTALIGAAGLEDAGLRDVASLAGLGLVLLLLGIGGLVVSLGLWRRRGWARMATLVYYALGILQALAALGSEGFGGLVGLGLSQVVIGLFAFFYLTRPHVAAAFRHQSDPATSG